MAKRKAQPPKISPDAGLSPEELRLAEEAGQLVYAVDAAIRAAGVRVRRLTVAGGEGVVVLTGVVTTAAAKRRAGEIAGGVPGVTEVVNSIIVRR